MGWKQMVLSQELGCTGTVGSLQGWIQQSFIGKRVRDVFMLEGFLELWEALLVMRVVYPSR